LVPMFRAFNLAIQNWESDEDFNELSQQARIAMQRITSELRYAAGIKDHSNPYDLYFFTRTLLNNGWEVENIEYWLRTTAGAPYYALMRSQDDKATEYAIAGSPVASVSGISVISFELEFLQWTGSNFAVVQSSDPSDWIDTVGINLTLEKVGTSKTVSLSSRIKLRNK